MRRRRQITCLVGGIYVYDDGCHNTFALFGTGNRIKATASGVSYSYEFVRNCCEQATRVLCMMRVATCRIW
jgi:hypothetical protein